MIKPIKTYESVKVISEGMKSKKLVQYKKEICEFIMGSRDWSEFLDKNPSDIIKYGKNKSGVDNKKLWEYFLKKELKVTVHLYAAAMSLLNDRYGIDFNDDPDRARDNIEYTITHEIPNLNLNKDIKKAINYYENH